MSGASDRFELKRSPLVVAPLVFIGAFVLRSFLPVFDPIVLSITVGLVIVVGLMLAGRWWAGIAFMAFPIALFTSPAGREFAFNLSSTDDTRWRLHALVGLLSLGVSSIAAALVAWGPRPRRGTFLGGAGGLIVGMLMIVALGKLYPTPKPSIGVLAAQRLGVPEINLLNYGFEVPELAVEKGTKFRALLINRSSLPHTLTIKSLGVEVYVPAKRRAVLELNPDQLGGAAVPVYCSIGDHQALGMARNLEFLR